MSQGKVAAVQISSLILILIPFLNVKILSVLHFGISLFCVQTKMGQKMRLAFHLCTKGLPQHLHKTREGLQQVSLYN